MKSRMIKLAACLFAGAMILTAGGGTAMAAEDAVMDAVLESAKAAAAPTAAEALVENPYRNMAVSLADPYVNVRSKADTDSKIAGIMKKNTVAEITGEEGDWYAVKSGSISGYVKKEYLSVGDQALIESVKFREAKVTTETLRVRAEASEDADVVCLVGMDDRLKVVSEDAADWVKVKTSDGEGFVSLSYVEVSDAFHYAEKPEKEDLSSAGGSGVADYALKFVGNPYAWGGTSLTNGADCSGFVMSVYAHFGVSLPHSSSALRGAGKGVSYSEAQPGDIICYPGHVGIYIGGGQIVHASNPSDGIKVSSATYRSISAVRRIY